MIQELNVGETVVVDKFAFMNKAGGTGMSNWDYDERFFGEAKVKIVQCWDDYECGERAVAEPVSADLKRYIKRNAKSDDQRVFISEFDLKK